MLSSWDLILNNSSHWILCYKSSYLSSLPFLLSLLQHFSSILEKPQTPLTHFNISSWLPLQLLSGSFSPATQGMMQTRTQEFKLRPRLTLACWDALKLWVKPFCLWKSFCINSLAYLFRHLEKTPNPTSTFSIREKHLLPDWPVTDSRGWWQPSLCSQEDWEVLPLRNVPTLGQAQLRGATKWQWCCGLSWGWEGCRKKPPPLPAGICGSSFSLSDHHLVTLTD